MMWLAWRQFRAQAAVIYGAVAALAVLLAATGPQLAHRYDTSGSSFLNDMPAIDTGHLTVAGGQPGAWITSQQTINASGRPASPSWMANCQPQQLNACVTRLSHLGYRQLVTYQPASRFWPLQLEETVIYLVLALALAGLCIWQVRRRLS